MTGTTSRAGAAARTPRETSRFARFRRDCLGIFRMFVSEDTIKS